MLETYLVSVVMKSTILLAAGLLLLRCLRGQSAAVLHLVCLTALGSTAIVPALALWLPKWSYFVAIPAGTGAVLNPYRLGSAFHHWPAMLATLWAVGAIVLAIRVAGGWLILRRARRGSIHFLQGEAAEVRIGNVSTPLTCGVVKPLIILWWNPLARMMSARADQEQERACDEVVLSAGVAPEDYARALLDTARECSSSLLLACTMSSSSVLRARLEHLFVWRPEVRRATRRTALAIPLLLALMTGVSCATKRMPQPLASCASGCILSGTNLVLVPNARGAAPRTHK